MIEGMAYSYHHLTAADVPLMKGLLRMFGRAFDDVATYQHAVPNDGYLGSLLATQHFIALAATTGQEVVGGLAAYVLDKFERDRREIYIYDLAVAEEHRRHGIATTLIKRLIDIAKERRAYVIFVQADSEDGPAIKLYESLGTKEEVYHFDIAVTGCMRVVPP
jgi:aminoglycoside 3-N-acetyltransferase I